MSKKYLGEYASNVGIGDVMWKSVIESILLMPKIISGGINANYNSLKSNL